MGHCGITKTMENLKKYFWFTNMKQVTTKYINSCLDCAYYKRATDETNYHLHVPEIKPIPFHKIHIDHLGPFPKSKRGNTYLIGMFDAFSKFAVLKPTRTTSTNGVLKMMDEVTQYFGLPTVIVTDRGTAFTSKDFGKYCTENAIIHVKVAVRTPRGNGQAERYFRTAKAAITTMAKDSEGRDWDKNVPAIQWALNSMKHSTTKVSPQEILMSYEPRSILKNQLILALQDSEQEEEEENLPLAELRERILKRIKEKGDQQAEKFNQNHKLPRQYNVGDLVLIRQEPYATGESKKVQPRFRGPYQVEEALGNDRYVLVDTDTIQIKQKPYKSVHAADRMKQWCTLHDFNFDSHKEGDEEEDKPEETK